MASKKPIKKKKKSNLVEKMHKILDNFLVVIAVIVVLAVFGGAYYFIIAPNLISKPLIEKPVLAADGLYKIGAGESVISAEHINYLINEIGAYKLKKPFGSEDYPIMEFLLTDTNERYYAYVKDNVPKTKKGNAKAEDIIIKGSQETVFKIISSDNLILAVKEAEDKGEVEVEFTSDMKVLAVKGYLSLYDTLK